MLKPKAIIYSRRLHSFLLNEVGNKSPAKVAGTTLRIINDEIKAEHHRRRPGSMEYAADVERLESLPESRTTSLHVNKILVGDDTAVAHPDAAYSHDLECHQVIVFDLDVDLAGAAGLRVSELVMGLTGDGNFKTPALWSDIAATAHTVIFVQGKTCELSRNFESNKMTRTLMLAGVALPKMMVNDNYDLLPIKLIPFDSANNLGRDLERRARVLPGLPARGEKAVERWLAKATAFRFVDTVIPPPAGMRYVPLVELSERGAVYTVAGACQVGKTIVGFIPAADLKPLEWIKGVADLGRTVFREELFGTVVDDSALPRMRLIARKSDPAKGEKPDRAVIFLEISGQKYEMQVPARTGKGKSRFSVGHLDLLRYIVKDLGGADQFEAIEGTTREETALLSDLRRAAAAVLLKAHLPKSLARTIFPLKERRVGIPVDFLTDDNAT